MVDLVKLTEQLDKERRKVDVDHFDITIRELVRMNDEGELKRAPVYQRKFRWDLLHESMLIESLYLGLPVPSVFVATNNDGTWELVDGLQRISTLVHYVATSEESLANIDKNSPLQLSSLEKLTYFNGLSFADLPTHLQLAFYKRSLRVTALSDKSDLVARFDLFERLNTGGIALTAQEVRACIYRGKFSDFLRQLSHNPTFRSILKLQKLKQDDGTSEEVVLKFFAYLYDRNEFSGEVKEFLNNYMRKSTIHFNYRTNKRIFEETVKTVANALSGPFLRENLRVTPLNQLEAVMVGVGELIRENKPIRLPEAGWTNDEELVKYSKEGTNTRLRLNNRVRRAKELFSSDLE